MQYISQANLLYPPRSILLLNAEPAETGSIRSHSTAYFSMRSQVPYYRKVSFKQASSVTDWQSVHARLKDTSSFVAGQFRPGYYLGHFSEVFGYQVLRPLVKAQIILRLRSAARYIKKFKTLQVHDRRHYLRNNSSKILSLSQDLLELQR